MNELVVDASSFILWSEVSFLEIIIDRKLFSIVLTKDVADELKDEDSLFYLNKGMEKGVVKIVEVENKEKDSISVRYRLGKGEISCIAFCMKEGKLFVTDDKLAKKKAEKEKVKVLDTSQLIKEFVKDEKLLMLIKEKFKKFYPERFLEL
jgi:predicted nucleic acid-binding protein